jgi:DNA polymerase I-like protein with 3'-5' exonuclease and polymerase domains
MSFSNRPWCVLDFETEAIGLRPNAFPPKSVGVALWEEGKKPRYLAYGHPTMNNCTWEQAASVLVALCETHNIITHNGGAFDMVILNEEFGIPWPSPYDWEDTLYLAYLYDPYMQSLALKDIAVRLCKLQPTERDDLKAYILAKVPGAAAKPREWGAHIAKAPGDLVGRYAVADVTMTKAVYDKLRPLLVDNDTPAIRVTEKYRLPMTYNMEPAYYREKKLAPILAESERVGVRVDRVKLGEDLSTYASALARATLALQSLLGFDVEIDSDAQVADALDKLYPDAQWVLTAKGARSTSKANLVKTFGDNDLTRLLIYRASLATCVRTFMVPWLDLSTHDGRLHPRWNQVRGERGGTRTGRLSCDNPNLANVPKEFPKAPEGYPELPFMRVYLIPDEGCMWLRTDAMQQELRALAHFEDAALLDTFKNDPTADMHTVAQGMVKESTGLELTRKEVKTVAFSIMYGAGLGLLADRLGVSDNEASELKSAYLGAIPGILMLQKQLKNLARAGAPFRTIGGRRYFVEPPKSDEYGRFRSFDYKMLNTLIQGSAGDLMKEAIINYHESGTRKGRFMLSVYDEMNASVPIGADFVAEAIVVQRAFAGVSIDVPMLSDSSYGATYGNSEEFPLGMLLPMEEAK